MPNKIVEHIEPIDTDLTEITFTFQDGVLKNAKASANIRILNSSTVGRASVGVDAANLPQNIIDDAEAFIPKAIAVIKSENGF